MPDPPAGPAPLTVRDLARQVLDMLDRQQDYFRWKDQAALEVARTAEVTMRKTCQAILRPPQKGLFDRC